MRSQLIFGALTHVRNRYELCQLASKASRKLHKPTTRLQDTMNEVLVRFTKATPVGEYHAGFERGRTQIRRAAYAARLLPRGCVHSGQLRPSSTLPRMLPDLPRRSTAIPPKIHLKIIYDDR